MTTPDAPQVECERQHPVLSAPDIVAAVDFYTTRLGFAPGFTWGDPPTFAGVNLGSVQVFLQSGTPSPSGCSVYFAVGDADDLCAWQRAKGVEVLEPPGDRDYGFRDYTVRDLNGYRLTFGHYIYNMGPALEIERVDVPVRLEKRLAAVLRDLAIRKRMSLNSCLEETLLHTFEPLGDGVASPHTKADLRYIQALKERHGIDYDSHASYRFTEKGT
jgi:catechol 2,3-dioxygenase-like lactoylglutathione lyase family enzyme